MIFTLDLFGEGTEYFAFETRVRAMVLELVEPCVKRSVQEREMMGELRQAQALLRKKLDECEFIVQKAQKKTTNTDDLAKQLANLVQYIPPCLIYYRKRRCGGTRTRRSTGWGSWRRCRTPSGRRWSRARGSAAS